MITREEWQNLDEFKKYQALDKEGNKVRIGTFNDKYGFIYHKGKHKSGDIVDLDDMLKYFTLIHVDEDKEWHKRLSRAIKLLKKSGLWGHMLELYESLYQMTYQDKKNMEKLYYSFPFRFKKVSIEEWNRVFKSVFMFYLIQYPFCFYEDEDGYLRLDYNYINTESECELKSMYFGYNNKDQKELIRSALEEKRNYSTHARTSYDVEFHYDSNKEKAYYYEYYKGSGNGHFYMALNENTAIFAEND